MAGPKPRVIALSKREGQSYGFYLRIEEGAEGHLVRALEMGGPAELAGLKDGDRIIRVNGTFVDNLEHSQVADLVKKSGLTVTFHVLGEEAYQQAKRNGINLAEPQSYSAQSQPTMNGVPAAGPKLKLCFLLKSSSGFGFSIKSCKGPEGMFMTDVIVGGAADNAGVKAGDRLVEINGENVEGATHDQTVEKVKAAGKSVMFLLVDKDTDKYYKNKCIRLGTGLATTKHLPMNPRIVEITKGASGYGFFLKADPKTPGHFIGEIDRGSPAEKGGLKEMDQLVAVDGEEVNHCTHEQVVDKIRELGNRCCLLVVDTETDKMYKMGGVSPLLYWEEMRSSLPQMSNPEPEHNVTPVPAMADAPEVIYKPKLCRMEKGAAGYGFHLNGIQGVHGQYIKEVVKGGPADRAGLEDEDIVVEVNGVNIEESTHEEAVNLIRSSGDTLVLLVAGKAAYDHLKAKGVAITPKPLDTEQTPVQPRERTPSVSSTSSSESEDERL
ncbi:Na(+)/H(+) exchange regulatory cofactor NHE-RF3 [Pangasianodon hypophthalmus]|uniref:Na(+)/H(+) exchange regulatory cofactor NHE-RF3 n=1 Tax=Pangasianodon hypophthalmus TaxID=310915 RepID=UPI0023079794|nr:Na(+)/H(+) exchange regulatory cofactor NHE-RF3 [Pangasianodon hypophthalmus]